ncbi:VUT family protein [Peptococcaceae bacterium 1198_IL3148]
MGYIYVLLYLAAIVTANILSAKFAPVAIGPFLISLGTFTIAATFVLRDLVQNRFGRTKVYIAIAVALGLSMLSSHLLGDTYAIVIASGASFLVSESTDTEIYTRLKASLAKRVFWSGLAGGILDSSVFVILGLSPLGAGFIPWAAVPMAVIGQIIFKTILQGIGAAVIGYSHKKRDVCVGV